MVFLSFVVSAMSFIRETLLILNCVLPPGMKFFDKFVVSRLEATRKALFLRYGIEDPCKKCPPKSLLSYADVAKMM